MTDSTVVLKFGGTSVRDAEAMRRVVQITETQRTMGHPIVVTSACAGVTDQLLNCARLCGAGNQEEALSIVHDLRTRHLDILSMLNPPEIDDPRAHLIRLLNEIEQLARGVVLLGELTLRTIDAFASFGERLSSILLAAAFRASGWRAAVTDSRTFIITDSNFTEATPIMSEITARAPQMLLPYFLDYEVVVAQGFIGSTTDGVTSTIGRGGSDHTGALIGAALGSREIQIWTDVSGILTADPRIVPNAHVVPEITFSEARALAYFGAKVIHPDTILPAVERDIPVVIKNSLQPEDAGTRILPDSADVTPGIHSVTMKKDVTVLRIAPQQQGGNGHIEYVLQYLASHNIPVLCAQRAESHAAIALQRDAVTDTLRTALQAVCVAEELQNVTLLCLSGGNITSSLNTLATPLTALGNTEALFVAAGASNNILIIALREDDAVDALKAVHEVLF